MVTRILVFIALTFLCCGYALWRGGGPERVMAAGFLAGCAGTLAFRSDIHIRFSTLDIGLCLVDVAFLIFAIAVVLCADRVWPIVFAGLHMSSVFGHFAKFLVPDTLRVTYVLMIVAASYPMLLLLVAGTWRHRRRLAAHGHDNDWIWSPRRTAGPPRGEGRPRGT